MTKLSIPFIAIIVAFSCASKTFTTSNYFLYVGPSARTSADVQNINNYQAVATDPCNGFINICGVTLTTAKTIGQLPVPAEFNSIKTKIWQSQQMHSPQDAAIAMDDTE